ncbi:MAG: GreA/GreB family elongation factor, partial [Lentisphaeria bacterium]|nr:GreA/GreB family elongation factor [Lentisphaeria bacterium]
QEITSILCSSAQRPDQASELCEVLSRLWRARGDTQWVRDLVDQIGAEAICWSDSTLFAQLSDDLAGKLVPAWFRTTQKVMGPDYVAKHCLDLPLRLWAHVEKIFGEDSATSDLLLERATAQLRSRDTSSDAILWAWKSRNAAKDLIASSPLVFKTLAKTLHGSYLKANRDLRKLLMENEAFQSHLMRGGEDQAIISLVNSVRHLPLLDTGERQSLLVRIVRIFPDARKLVEEKHGQPTMQAIARQTSVRMYEIRRLELEEIINVKIPANSRAIGHAREYGDLRENAEFKAAKEEQVFLTARRNELEVDLHEIRATDFSDVEPNEVVVPGTTVKLQTEEDNVVHTYHVLGLWDSVPERQMLSYDTPLGKLLTGARVGDELELPSEETAELIEVLELPDEIKEWVKISSLDES